jgi:hypothetical protein
MGNLLPYMSPCFFQFPAFSGWQAQFTSMMTANLGQRVNLQTTGIKDMVRD